MKTINETIETINAIRKQIADIDNRIIECVNNRDYEKLAADKMIALYDLRHATEKLNYFLSHEIDMEETILSSGSQKIVDAELTKRADALAAKFQNA